MDWKWQQPDWPRFRWKAAALTSLEARFLLGMGVQIGAIKHIGEDDRKLIRCAFFTPLCATSLHRQAMSSSQEPMDRK